MFSEANLTLYDDKNMIEILRRADANFRKGDEAEVTNSKTEAGTGCHARTFDVLLRPKSVLIATRAGPSAEVG